MKLHTQIFVAMALGVAVGLPLNFAAEAGTISRDVALQAGAIGEWFGKVFLTLLNMVVVPLILASFGPVRLPDNTVVSEPVGLIDLPATVCALAEVVCDGGEGIDLSPAWTGGALPPRIRYAEATKPMRFESKTAWNNLPMERSAVGPGPSGPLQLKIRPLNADARFLHRVAVGAPSVDGPDAPTRAAAKELLDGLAAWDAAAPAHRDATYDDETRQALIELGYLDPEDVAAPE